jgi:CubicO group peptidase (beta-lactamase class C family)
VDQRELVASCVAGARAEYADLVVGVSTADGRSVAGTDGVDGASIFRIASISKVFTGLTLAGAVRRGEVALTDEARAYSPYPMPTWDGEPIRLWHLATHSSGLGRHADVDDVRTVDALLSGVAGLTLADRPGTRWDYCNLGMGTLAQLLARAVGRSFEELVADRICAPLGLTDTVLELTASQRERRRPGHDDRLAPVATLTIPVLAGSGGYYSTVDDLLTLLETQLAAAPDTPFALAEQSRFVRDADGRIDAPVTGPYGGMGLGWLHDPVPGTAATMIWHNGALPGYRSFAGYVRDPDCAVVVLTNTSRSVDGLGAAVLADLSLSCEGG